MALLDFPDPSASPYVAPNGVIYTYEGTAPNGYWSGTNSVDASDALKAQFVEVVGDNMTGALTIGPDGGPAVTTLDAEGSGTFAKNVTLSGSARIGGGKASNAETLGVDVLSTGSVNACASGSNPVFTGQQLGTSLTKAKINADGSATFAGSVVAGSSTHTTVAIEANTNKLDRSAIVSTNHRAGGKVWEGRKGDGTVTSSIEENGSATFAAGNLEFFTSGSIRSQSNFTLEGSASYVQVNRDKVPNANDILFFGSAQNDEKFKVTSDGSATFAGNVTLTSPANFQTSDGAFIAYARPANTGLTVYQYGTNAAVSRISGDGSAEFAGNVAAARLVVDGTKAVIGDYYSIVIDTTGAIIGGWTNADGAFKVGGTLPSSPNISLNADGSATFAGGVESRQGILADQRMFAAADMPPSGSSVGLSVGQNNSALIYADGSASFASNVTSGPSASIGGRIRYTTYGTDFSVGSEDNFFLAHYGGDSTLYAGLKNDGSATFAGTVTANGTILTRASGTLDVGDRLEKADNALQALKTAAAAAADFAALKSAIATALADI